METRTLEELLDEARAKIVRFTPAEASGAAQAGALIVDIRSDDARERLGVVPGSLHVPRSVLEWRFEPGGRWRNRHVAGVDRQLILICDHGYSSILAAATLVALGYAGAGDVLGGFDAWRAAGLPVGPPEGTDGGLPGMGVPG